MRGNVLGVTYEEVLFCALHEQLKESEILTIQCFKVNAPFPWVFQKKSYFFSSLSINFTRKSATLNFSWRCLFHLKPQCFGKGPIVGALFFSSQAFIFCFICQTASISLRLLFGFLLDTLFGCFTIFLAFWVCVWGEGVGRGWGEESAIKKAAAFSRGK